MLVKFAINVGSRDAESFGLDFNDCCLGKVLDVPDDTGRELVKRRLANLVTVKGVSAAPALADAKPVELKAEPKTPATAKPKPQNKES